MWAVQSLNCIKTWQLTCYWRPGCAPPPGTYEIKPEDLKGAASFDKSDRFKLVKAGGWKGETHSCKRGHSFIHVTSCTINFIISSRSATAVSNPKCPCVPREKDHVRRWTCEFYSILFIFNRSSARQTVPQTWPDPLPLCSVETKVECSSAKKEKIGMSLAKKQQRQLEKEVHWLSNFYHWLLLLCYIS